MDINVSCHVVSQYLAIFDDVLQRILGMSPNATRLSLSMGIRDPTMGIHDLLVPSTCQYDLSKVVHLAVQVGHEHLSDILLCLPQCKSLTVLSLSIDTCDKDYVKYLILEHLQEFQITVETALQSVQSVLDRCPALEHLALFPPMTEFTTVPHYTWEIFVAQDFAVDGYLGDVAPLRPRSQCHTGVMEVSVLSATPSIRLLDWALLRTIGPHLHLVIPPDSVQHHETLQWRFPGVHVQHNAGHIYCVSSYVAACAGHEYFRNIDNVGVDSMSGDSDSDSDDVTFESAPSVSYSAYDSEEGDLETVEYFPIRYYDPEKHLEDKTNTDFETTLQTYQDMLGT
ncbi:hypothetical protein BDR03DRAFT_1086542 [Suillus americanus]|nr:hypothetical protein BDR03DRAFT_1086542 [Suillus americanus]